MEVNLSLRDYLAAKAMQALVASQYDTWSIAAITAEAYIIADYMIKQREEIK